MPLRHDKFKDSDFACQCGCGLGINDMKPEVLELLYRMRDELNKPIIINSAVRCERHNIKVGGSSNSAHLRGYALDIRTSTSQMRYAVEKWLLANGVRRVGHNFKTNFIHFDLDPSLTQDIIFPY